LGFGAGLVAGSSDTKETSSSDSGAGRMGANFHSAATKAPCKAKDKMKKSEKRFLRRATIKDTLKCQFNEIAL
jgi:hypothetical protein